MTNNNRPSQLRDQTSLVFWNYIYLYRFRTDYGLGVINCSQTSFFTEEHTMSLKHKRVWFIYCGKSQHLHILHNTMSSLSQFVWGHRLGPPATYPPPTTKQLRYSSSQLREIIDFIFFTYCCVVNVGLLQKKCLWQRSVATIILLSIQFIKSFNNEKCHRSYGLSKKQ